MLTKLIILRLKGLFSSNNSLLSKNKEKKMGVGKIILFIFLTLYLVGVGFFLFFALFDAMYPVFKQLGLTWAYFAFGSFISLLFCVFGSIFIVYNEIYEAKDNDLLLSMPISPSLIIYSRVFTVLLLNILYCSIIYIPLIYVYINSGDITSLGLIFTVLSALLISLLSIAISSFAAFILAHVLKFIGKFKVILSIIVFVVFFGFYFYFINHIQTLLAIMLQSGASIASALEKYAYPFYKLGSAIYYVDILDYLIFILCTLVPFIIASFIIQTSFIKIATSTKLNSNKKSSNKKLEFKGNSVISSLMKKEFKLTFSNASILLNCLIGSIFAIIATVYLFLNYDLLNSVINELNLSMDKIVLVATIASMSATSLNTISASSISLEGASFMILKTLPIKTKDILLAKWLFHFVMSAPFTIIFSIITCVLFKIDVFSSILVIVTPLLFIAFIDSLGLSFNLMKPKFDWINETQCVKQSMSTLLITFTAMGLVGMLMLICLKTLFSELNGVFVIGFIAIIFLVINVIYFYLLKNWGCQKYDKIYF